MSACADCGHAHVAGDAIAQNRFVRTSGFRTADGQVHATREQAQRWLCEQRQLRAQIHN